MFLATSCVWIAEQKAEKSGFHAIRSDGNVTRCSWKESGTDECCETLRRTICRGGDSPCGITAGCNTLCASVDCPQESYARDTKVVVLATWFCVVVHARRMQAKGWLCGLWDKSNLGRVEGFVVLWGSKLRIVFTTWNLDSGSYSRRGIWLLGLLS